MLLVNTSRHKAASSWSRLILREAAGLLGLPVLTVIHPEQWAAHGSLGALIEQQRPGLLNLTNVSLDDYLTLPSPRRTVNVIRDPRDIIVSGYYSHRNTHAVEALGVTWHELIEHRRRLHELDAADGLLEEIEFSGYFLDHMSTWDYSRPEVLELTMEEMIGRPEHTWARIFDHYGLIVPRRRVGDVLHRAAVAWNRRARPRLPLRTLPSGYLGPVLAKTTFSALSGSDRRPGQVDEMNHYRKGIPGDWRNHFTERHLKAFRHRYGDLAERLGYPSE